MVSTKARLWQAHSGVFRTGTQTHPRGFFPQVFGEMPWTAGQSGGFWLDLVGATMMTLAKLLVRLHGTAALKDPEVAKLLQLSDTQEIRIRDVQRKSASSLRDRFREILRSGEGRKSLRDSLRRLRQDAERRVVSLLDTQQKEKFDSLKGGDSN